MVTVDLLSNQLRVKMWKLVMPKDRSYSTVNGSIEQSPGAVPKHEV